MEFRKFTRVANVMELKSDGWRLPSVKEVHNCMEEATRKKLFDSVDRVRLLDGWIDASSNGYNCEEGWKAGIQKMLLVKVSKPLKMYSTDLTGQGREAALLLFCEDNITQVILLVLNSIVENFKDGHRQEELFRLMESMKKKFGNEKMLMHYAADQQHNMNLAKTIAEVLMNEFERGKELVKAADKYGRTALHFAAFRGNTDLCNFLIQVCKMSANLKDQNGENLLHFAVRGKTSKSFESLCQLWGVEKTIDSQDEQGKTALHKAAAKGRSLTKIQVLFSKLEDKQRKEYIGQADLLGQTAIHEATRGGHYDELKRLLDEMKRLANRGETARLLLERDSDGKTALHYAVQLSKEETKMRCTKLLLKRCESDEEKSLLLWASATGIGTAEEYLKTKKEKQGDENTDVEEYLIKKRKKLANSSDNLLKSAVKLGHYNMACELVNRGANPAQLRSGFVKSGDHKHAQNFLKQIREMPERGRDQPTIDDGLGRKHFAEGLAALFLNPCVKTPVTVGILGDWGMGKSSLMIQTEIIMLRTAAQLAFPNLLVTEVFPGSEEFKLSRDGERKYDKIKKAIKDLKLDDLKQDEDPLLYFLDNYQKKYHEVYRALALMDRAEMIDVQESDTSSNRHSLLNIPTILTVTYNSWQYKNEGEAWAGLAVEIPKAIEESMTGAQRLRCRWRYVWREQRNKMYMELFLPCFLAVFLSCLVTLVLWRLFSRLKDKELAQLKYGSIPITIMITVWTVMKQVNSVLKTVSAQIMGYLRVPDHSINLGYQHQVISDIKFSKKELVEKPSCLWKFIAWIWSFCGFYPDNVKGTCIPRSSPPCEDGIRIIVFVDDLDRCQDKVILQVLSAVNLVLAACEINVILGMDKKMIIRAIENQFKGEKSDPDLAEKYLSKIVQLPLALPDTNDDEIKEFVKQQLGQDLQGYIDEDQNSNIGKQDPNPRSDDGTGGHRIVDIPQSITDTRPDFSSKMIHFFQPVMRFTNCLFGCKPGVQDKISKRQLSSPLKMMMMLPNYSPKERDAITCLSKVAEDSGRLPREWKRFLTYHRVAWNILYQSEEVRNCAGWQVQLLVWIFCCWQWKDQINEIIENWKKLVILNDPSVNDDEPNWSGNDKTDQGAETETKTKSEVENDLEQEVKKKERGKAKKEEKQRRDENADKSKAEEEEEEEQGQEPRSLRRIIERYMEGETEMKGKVGTNEEEKEKEKDKWVKLKNTLVKYDVSMEGIRSFQKFRLHCNIQNLPIPPPPSDKNSKQPSTYIARDTLQGRSSSSLNDAEKAISIRK